MARYQRTLAPLGLVAGWIISRWLMDRWGIVAGAIGIAVILAVPIVGSMVRLTRRSQSSWEER